MSENDALLAEATVQWYATGLMRGALSLPEQSRAADVVVAFAARVRELEADLALCRRREQNLDGLLTYLRTETARIVSQPVGEASEVVDTVRQLKQYADGRDAKLAALRAAKDEAERRMRNAEETNRVNESCLRNAMAEADALREDKARLDWLAYDMDNSPLFDALGDHDVHSMAAALWPHDREPSTDEERETYRQAFRAAIDAARKEEG